MVFPHQNLPFNTKHENSAHNPYLEEPEKFYILFEEFLGIKN